MVNLQGKTIEQEKIENKLEKFGNTYIQTIIPNNHTVIRAFVNSYYWISNELQNIISRNLQYYSELQTNLTNLYLSEIFDFIKNSNFNLIGNQKIKTAELAFLIEINFFENVRILEYKMSLSQPSHFINNGIYELSILSKIKNIIVIIFNNYLVPIIVIDKGYRISDDNIKKYNDEKIFKNSICIQYDYSSEMSKPDKIKSIYF